MEDNIKNQENYPYVCIRSSSAGVFMGYMIKRDGQEVTLKNSRRIWYWDGANSISQLAMEGTKKPENCKFPCEVDEMLILEVIEIIPVSEKIRLQISGIPVWSAR